MYKERLSITKYNDKHLHNLFLVNNTMAPFNKLYKSEQDAKANSQQTMFDFLMKPRGRPKKRGVPISVEVQATNRPTKRSKSAAATHTTAAAAPPSDTSKKQIVAHTNWSQGSDLIKLTAAVTN